MERIKEKVKAIIFDMDGTIIKSEHIWKEAVKNVLQKRGFDSLTEKQTETLCSLSGIGLENASKVIKKEFKLSDSIEELVKEKKDFAKKRFLHDITFIDGFETFHKKLQQFFIPTSIASNCDLTSMNIINKKMNFSQFFGNNVYSIEMIGNKAKPDPAIFLHAAEKLNVKPSECIVFEDSIFGFQAANAAGMKCIAIKNNLNKNNLSLANYAIDNYDDAEQALSFLLK